MLNYSGQNLADYAQQPENCSLQSVIYLCNEFAQYFVILRFLKGQCNKFYEQKIMWINATSQFVVQLLYLPS